MVRHTRHGSQIPLPSSQIWRLLKTEEQLETLSQIPIEQLTEYWGDRQLETLLDLLGRMEIHILDLRLKVKSRYGFCQSCGRPLTAPLSVDRALGPVCHQHALEDVYRKAESSGTIAYWRAAEDGTYRPVHRES